jgi:phosphomannomutase
VLKTAGGIGDFKLVIDAGNGVTGAFLPKLLEELPCRVTRMYFEPDGTFPHHEANPLKPENVADLQAEVKRAGADLGVAFDGDRCAFVDENADIVTCDIVTALIAKKVLEEHPGSPVLYDLRSSRVVPEEIERGGGRPVRSRVGHAYMKALMRRDDIPFGGELSGHYYFKDNYYTDSGFMAMLKVLALFTAAGMTFSQMVRPLRRYFATGELNFTVKDKDAKIREIARTFRDGQTDYLDGITVSYKDWWFNVRKSNTEPMLRLNLEAQTPQLRDAKMKELVGLLSSG